MKKTGTMILAFLMAMLIAFSAFSAGAFAAETDNAAQGADAALEGTGAQAPEFSSIEPCDGGLEISWKKLIGIDNYRLYRWFDDGRGWVQIIDTAELSYIDSNIASGNTYRYRLAGISAKGSILTTTTVTEYSYTEPPRITSHEVTSDGIRLRWSMPAGTAQIALYRRGNGWTRIATTSDSSYLDKDVVGGGVFTYTIRALDKQGNFVYDFFDEAGYSVKRLAAPQLSAANAAGGVRVSWNAVEGAENYRVFSKSGGSDWKAVGDTADTSFLDKSAASGATYTYTVRCISADGSSYTSYFDTKGKSTHYIAAPVLKSATAVNSGVSISWQACEGAYRYRVFYKNTSGGWTRMGDTASTSFTDEDVYSGYTYTYTVRCYDEDDEYVSDFYREGISCKYLSAPVITSLSSGADGVDIEWDAVEGAEKYRVYYYGSRGWTKLAETTDNKITDEDVYSGYTYTYTVRCINADGTAFTSGHTSGKSVKYYAAPVISGLTNTLTGVKISWNAVSGAGRYRVYYYGRNGWTRMTETTATSYLDADVSSGGTYTYTVRCMNSAGTEFISGFKPGVIHTYVAAPTVSTDWNQKSVQVSWDAVNGAELYRVYTRTANGWQRIADTTQTSYEDKSVQSGNTYTYTVRCLNAEANAFTSDFNAGKSIKYVETPIINKAESTPNGVDLSWNAVDGAEKYRVYLREDNGWKRIADTTDTSYSLVDPDSGGIFNFTVRCVNAAGNAFESSFDKTGASVRYIAAPKNIKAEPEGNAVRISWDLSPGAEKYRVYYYGSKGWTRMGETTGNSFLDEDVSSGGRYRYTVRCINDAGTEFTSDFDHTGVTMLFTYTPVLKTPEYEQNSIVVSWEPVKGAQKYRVYFRGSKGWVRMAETTSTSVIDDDVRSNQTYTYTVRCITSDGAAFTSDFDREGVKIYYCSAPRMTGMETSAQRVTFTWSQPEGSSLYRVYKKIDGSWKRLKDTTSNSYTDTDVEIGNTYFYTVRCLSSDGTKFISGFDPTSFVVSVISSVMNFQYFDQTQYDYPYGDDTIAYSGCGPTCFAMVASTITGRLITPIDAVSWCGNSYYVYGVGTRWDYFDAAADRFGIKLEGQTYSQEEAIAALKKGKYVINSHGYGRFTRGGHFIVLAGIDASGRIIVFDPNGGNHFVGASFTPDEIAESATSYWIFTKK